MELVVKAISNIVRKFNRDIPKIKKLTDDAFRMASEAKAESESKMNADNPVGTGSFSLNRRTNSDVGEFSHTEGYEPTASDYCSHAEGCLATASGMYSHAEGYRTTASGVESHAEGGETTASADDAHAEGHSTKAMHTSSHSQGRGTITGGRCQHVEGSYNIVDTGSGNINQPDYKGSYLHIVGNGSSDKDRSNAYTLDWNGNGWYQGNVEGLAMIVKSTTPNSTKRFKITVDDSGTISTAEVT